MARSIVVEVAAWEFWRFFKWKEQLVGLLLLVGGGLVGGQVARWASERADAVVHLAVVAPTEEAARDDGEAEEPALAALFSALTAARFEAALESEQRALERLQREEIAGVLYLERAAEAAAAPAADDGWHTRLVVPRLPGWDDRLRAALAEHALLARLAERGEDASALAALLGPPALEIQLTDPDAPGRGKADRVAAMLIIALILMGLFTGNAYLFMGITGEKQLRVTEQVLAAITPQQWIDGKILGLSVLTLTVLALYAVSGLLAVLAMRLAGLDFPLPSAALSPTFALAALVLLALGFAFWFTFFAAIAATIDDPNQSQRGIWLMLPALPLSAGFLLLSDPTGPLALTLALLPPTAPSALATRMALGASAWWELPIALTLLTLSTLLLRRAAGRIFAFAIEIRGKEPSWREMLAAARRAR
jgi:ABC-2 type transport system permease protein